MSYLETVPQPEFSVTFAAGCEGFGGAVVDLEGASEGSRREIAHFGSSRMGLRADPLG